ncbi:MAG: hypothetical protein AAFQ82_00605 [Myxococcota bacterium]
MGIFLLFSVALGATDASNANVPATVITIDADSIRLLRKRVPLNRGEISFAALTARGTLRGLEKPLRRKRQRPVRVEVDPETPITTLYAVTETLSYSGFPSLTIASDTREVVFQLPRRCRRRPKLRATELTTLSVQAESWVRSSINVSRGPDGCFETLDSLSAPAAVGEELVPSEQTQPDMIIGFPTRAPVDVVLSTGAYFEHPPFLVRPRSAPIRSSKAPTLIVFGGSAPPEIGEEVSLELQVDKLSSALRQGKPTVLFGSGRARLVRELQELPQNGALQALVGIGGWPKTRASTLRVNGTAERGQVLEALARSTDAAEGTVVFGVGHGSEPKGDGGSIDLSGGNGRLTVQELAQTLDRTGRRAATAFVLGHCFSGSFAELMFEARAQTPARPMRCTFSAVPADRPADGCVTNPSDRSIQAYAWMIGDALERSDRADLDQDRRVTLAEAHAYARIHDPTSNVPFSSSESWIRKRGKSRLSRRTIADAQAAATREDRAVLEALLPEDTSPGTSLSSVRRRLRRMNREVDRALRIVDRGDRKARALRETLLDDLWVADLQRALERGAIIELREIDRALSQRADVRALSELSRKIDRQFDAARELHHRAARLERFLRAAEVALLGKTLTVRDQRVLDEIRACEAMAPLP